MNDKDEAREVGQRFLRLVQRDGLTWPAAAAEFGGSPTHLCHVAYARRTPNVDIAARIEERWPELRVEHWPNLRALSRVRGLDDGKSRRSA